MPQKPKVICQITKDTISETNVSAFLLEKDTINSQSLEYITEIFQLLWLESSTVMQLRKPTMNMINTQ